ncbi:MAG: Sugar transferases involved in lipopolysaccharide synthesis [Rhodobacteraceae bacterium HLUCCA12]|nr:MAG: Sugar transferases involved in lipopolysaccharide synthesis [Rhodobacteraceae bacterium HLUCCA12]
MSLQGHAIAGFPAHLMLRDPILCGEQVFPSGIDGSALRLPVPPAPPFVAPGTRPPDPIGTAATGFYPRHAKRAIDVVLTLILIVLSAPVFVVLALALWLESGNPFYSQPRLGRNGRIFRMFKLRTMVRGADRMLAACLEADPALRAEWDQNQKLKKDPRVTPFGRLVRKTSMDELPQLFNVLRGDMSLIGPRPMLADQLPLYRHPEAYLSLRPGLSGLWQVCARNDQDFDTRARLDRCYFEQVSLWLDLRLFLASFRAIWRATGF